MLRRLLPGAWRDAVERDLREEARSAGWPPWRRSVWRGWQIARIACRFWWAARAEGDAPRGLLRGLGADLRLSGRLIRKQPGSAIAIVAILGLGIGATTATYAVFNDVLFRPVPGVRDESRLVAVYFQPRDRPQTWGFAPRADLPALRTGAPGLASLAIGYKDSSPRSVFFGSDAYPTPLPIEFVGAEYLQTLGVRLGVGRFFTGTEIAGPASTAVLISDRLWHDRFGGAAGILGQSLRINSSSFTIVGVVDEYRGWLRLANVDLWLPTGAESWFGDPRLTMIQLVGRLKDGVDPASVQAQLTAAFTRLPAPAGSDRYEPRVYAGLPAMSSSILRANVLPIFWTLACATGLLLLLACANAANLLLARIASRRYEFAVRQAIGAPRWRVIRQLVIEACALAGSAGVLGMGVALALTRAFQGAQISPLLPELEAVDIDRRVVAFAIAAVGATVLAFGVVPAIKGSSVDARSALAERHLATRSARRLRSSLMVAQMAISVGLLGAAGLLVRSVVSLYAVDLGLRPQGVMAFDLMPYRAGIADDRQPEVTREVVERLARSPGVVAAAFGAPGPLAWGGSIVSVRIGPALEPRKAALDMASPDYFRALGIPLLAGREFRPDEFERDYAGLMPVLINRSLSRQWFGDASALGRHVTLLRQTGHESSEQELEIVGVVGDTRPSDPRESARPRMYQPHNTQFRGGVVVFRTTLGITEAAGLARTILSGIDPRLAATEMGSLPSVVDRTLGSELLLAKVGTLIALLAALLAAAGVYAVVNYVVTERMREFGIRIALGASAGRMAADVGRILSWPVLTGAMAGTALFLLLGRLVSAELFGVGTADPLSVAGAILLVAAAAAAAAVLPARRAGRTDPTVTLRAE